MFFFFRISLKISFSPNSFSPNSFFYLSAVDVGSLKPHHQGSASRLLEDCLPPFSYFLVVDAGLLVPHRPSSSSRLLGSYLYIAAHIFGINGSYFLVVILSNSHLVYERNRTVFINKSARLRLNLNKKEINITNDIKEDKN